MNIGMGKNLFEVLQNCGICMCNKVCRSSSLNGINKNLVARTLLRIMGWEIVYLDILLVPLSILILLSYQCFLVWRVRNKPLQTVIGVNHLARKQWVFGIMKENDKKNILAVQTLRNSIMASTLMASTAIVMSSAIGAFMTSTYFSHDSSLLGGQSRTLLSIKYMSLIFCFLFSFLCYMQSVRYVNHVNYLINIPVKEAMAVRISPDYVANVLEKGNNFFTIGTRGFYIVFPLILWLFGPIPVILCAIALVPVLYYLDAADLNGDSECLRKSAERSWVLDLVAANGSD